ncbi:MAG: hypothetical protein IE916_12065, partial [Epsilonproteobacteria bacterium]|nr:hypothetical protein [Campylobacterota bacterium]
MKLLFAAAAFCSTLLSQGFISPQELNDILYDQNTLLLDVGSKSAYQESHIPGARFIDIDSFYRSVDSNEPPKLLIAKAADTLSSVGVKPSSHAVIYFHNIDKELGKATLLAYLLLKSGVESVSILDGGYLSWIFEHELLATTQMPSANSHTEMLDIVLDDLITIDEILDRNTYILLDSRPTPQYFGVQKARGVKLLGHIPSAQSSFYGDKFLSDGTLRERAELEMMFKLHELL